MYTGWGKSRANTSFLWGRRGDRSYRLINSYNVEEGRTVRVCFSVPALQDPPWFSLLFRPCVTTFRFLGPLDALLMSRYLHTSLLRHWGTQSQRKRAKTTLASWGSGLPLPVLCQDAFMEGDESPWNDTVACFSIVWVLARNILVKLSLGDLLYSRRNKLNKKVKDIWPKDE